MPQVSVIVPIYNVECYLKRCIDSILNQTYKNIEIILVDDGSTDCSPEICKSYEMQYENIIYKRKDNGGVSSARNEGLILANGAYILFVDADDFIDNTYIEFLIKFALENHSNMVKSGYKLVDENEYLKEEFNYSNHNIGFIDKDYTLFLKSSYFGYICATLIDSKIIKKYKINFNKKVNFAEDLLFIFECFKHCERISYVSMAGYNYRENMESATKKENIQIRLKECYDNIYVFSNFFDYVSDRSLVNAKIISRINMKLKYLIKTNMHIKFSYFKDCSFSIYSELEKTVDLFNYASNVFDNTFNKLLILLFCKKKLFLYFCLVKSYYRIRRR